MAVTYWVREDSGSANNPALNLTGANSFQITFDALTASGNPGDLELDQPAGGGVDPDTQVLIDGTSYSFTFELTGTLPTLKRDGSQQVPDQFEDNNIVIITIQDYPSPGETTRLSFMPDVQASQAEMDAFGNGAIDIQNVNTAPPATPVCFVKGTLITTPSGQIRIEDLRAGDLVETLDQGNQTIRWIGFQSLPAHGKYAPIRIQAGALGNTRDLLVSPQHRMLLTGWKLELLFDSTEVLATAKSLINDRLIMREEGGVVEYYHILFDTHQIIFAEGSPSESFHPGVQAMNSYSQATRREIYELFPALMVNISNYGRAARISLKPHEAAIAVHILKRNPMSIDLFTDR